MNSLNYAKQLSAKQGPTYALAIAENMYEVMRVLVQSNGGCPFAEEVEVQEQTYVDKETKQQRTKTVINVNLQAQAKRQVRTMQFWQQVCTYLRKSQPKKAA